MTTISRRAIAAGLMLAGAATGAFAAASSIRDVCADCVVEKVVHCGGFIEGTTVSPDNQLWLVDLTGDRILQITSDGQCVAKGKVGSAPNGAKWAHDGTLVITARNGVYRFDPRTSTVSKVTDSFEGQPLVAPNDLAIDSRGGIYFTVPNNSSLMNPVGRVLYIAPGASAPELVADKLAYPNGITVTADDRTVLVSEFAGKRILALPGKATSGGMALSYVFAHTEGGVGGDGILADRTGRLYVANFNAGEILVYSPEGRRLGAIRLPPEAGLMTTNVAVLDGHLYISEAAKGDVWRVKLVGEDKSK